MGPHRSMLMAHLATLLTTGSARAARGRLGTPVLASSRELSLGVRAGTSEGPAAGLLLAPHVSPVDFTAHVSVAHTVLGCLPSLPDLPFPLKLSCPASTVDVGIGEELQSSTHSEMEFDPNWR